jgi:uncharacterized protein with ATP-grasp and redox domains
MNPIRTDKNNFFAHDTMNRRLPEIIRKVQDRNHFSDIIKHDLDKLHDELIRDAPISLPQLPAPDADRWLEDFQAHEGASWQNAEWFFAETYFFRQINEAVRYWQYRIDPYRPIKADELATDALRQLLETALSVDGSREERLSKLIEMALWGNRIDLSLPTAMAHGTIVNADDLLVDERELAIEELLSSEGIVHLITDNFGSELAMDLALVDMLIRLDMQVILHVKMHPTYVSDATVEDVHWMLDDFSQGKSLIRDFSIRLQNAMTEGRLQLAPDFYWNSCRFLNRIPSRLSRLFSDARLIILKGDANYRRAIFDTIYAVDSPFSQIVNYLPAPLLALRTLKSDPLLAVSQEIANRLDSEDKQWRVNGKRGVIQLAKKL